jgi:hypothetical protein
MGYYVDVTEHNIEILDRKKAEEILKRYDPEGIFRIEDSELLPDEYSFKWCSYIYWLLLALSKVARGYIIFRGEDNAIWMLELENGKITESFGRIVFEKTMEISIPEEVLADPVIINERYIAAVAGRKLAVHDRLKKTWHCTDFHRSADDLILLEDLYRGKELHICWHGLEYLGTDEIEEFLKKITEKDPETAQKLKREIVPELI